VRARTVFVLSGGANCGAVQVGMLRALLDAGIVPDAVIGASVGAINAAALAVDPTRAGVELLTEAWLQVRRDDVFPGSKAHRLLAVARRQLHVHDPAPLRALVERWLPMHDLSETRLPAHVATTELATGRTCWWTTGRPADVLAASAALPLLFPPVELDGALHVDGAVAQAVPLSRAADIGARRVYVLDAGATSRPNGSDPASGFDVLWAAFRAARLARLELDRASLGRFRKVVWLPPVDVGRLPYWDFSRTAELIEAGERTAAEHLAGLPRMGHSGTGGAESRRVVVH
jgi:NTE family protein